MLCAIFSVQVILPLVLCVAIGVVKESQEKFIRSHITDQAAFEEIRMSKSQYDSSRINEKEIVRDGKTYDVVSVNLCKDGVLVKVLADTREDGLKKVGGSLEKEKKDVLGSVISLCFSFAYSEQKENAVPLSSESFSFIPQEDFSCLENVGKVSTPPPDAMS